MDFPRADLLRGAVATYVRHAYGGAAPSAAAVRKLVEDVNGWSGDGVPAGAVAAPAEGGGTRYTFRLGNRQYPHMKLALDPSPAGDEYLFRVDTHDGHVRPPPTSKEYPAFRELMRQNQLVAEAVEAAWAAEGVPTFRTFLERDLARRAAETEMSSRHPQQQGGAAPTA